MSTNAYYFSHDSNAKDDPKCMLLIDQLGLEGYGIFWVLIEVLREQPEYRYPLSLIPILARRYNTTPEKMNTVVKNYNLFCFDEENNFFSLSLNERMNKVQIGIEQRRNAGLASAEKRKHQLLASPVQRPLNECSTIKRKEKKEKEIKESIYSFENFWNDYDKKVGDKDKIQKKFNKLSEETRIKIKEHIPKYKLSEPDKKFRKNPETYLNNKSWNDEIIFKKEGQNNGKIPQPSLNVNEKWKR